MRPGAMKKVLITGGSGYLGQFLVCHLAKGHQVFYTFASTPAEFQIEEKVKGFKVDFASGDGLRDCLVAVGTLDAIVNCAAISQPGSCEKAPALARAINIPSELIKSLTSLSSTCGNPLFIQISTDQVYDGSKAYWKECDKTAAINAYGKSKEEAESYIQVNSLSSGKKTKFFGDEYRNPIYVMDIAHVVMVLLGLAEKELEHKLLNMGGPERLSRVDMAEKVANHLGLDKSLIESAPSASVPRGAPSPLDISMDVTRLRNLPINLTPFQDALRIIYET